MNKMGQETYFELTKRSIPIIKNVTAHLSWRNSIITVRTTKHVNFLEYSYNLECLERNLDFTESLILSPKDSPASDVCNANFLKSEMRNVDYTEMIVNSSFWPHNPALTQEMTSVLMCKWSPLNFGCVLAVLNNIGGVEFFQQQQFNWKSILNLSPYVTKILKHNRTPVFFEDLKESVFILETSAICWAPEVNSDNSCFFATAQKNGSVLFWQIFSNMDAPKVRGRIAADMTEITEMKWIPKLENNFYLICADDLGQVHAFDMEIENENISLLRPHALWPHKDRMIAANLKYTVIDNNIVFLCSKHRHLLIQLINNNGKVLSQYLNNVNDYRITDIAYTTDGIYLSTVNVKIYKINIELKDGNLNVTLDQLELKDPYPTYDLYGLRFSTNNVMCALAMANRKVLCRKEAHKMEVIFISTESKLESIVPTLINNPSKRLTYFWDCIELLRFQLTKLKVIPKIEFDELYASASQDAYKLKIYFIVMTYFDGLKKVMRLTPEFTLPETSPDVVKEKLLYFHAKSLLNDLCEKCQKAGKLSELDMETLYGSKNYIKYYCKKYRTEIEFDKNVLSVLENSCEYVCQCCDENIEGFTCKHGHLNIFCMLSFTPIMTDDYLVCRCCGTTARADLELVNPLCVFCDLNLVKPD
ncbi:hypothetical protein PYW07_008308 [Mythimna separata]|uniref:Transcription factor IIIC 90kDa subunit N-terminal domain-containing protein n=1 Tax=Mythimna separata TaxID=271217 RepID=A0AAD7YCX6_MYTSE|nr:hypothetical protein PYW07_008308 [Mythimna separata]